MVLDGLFTADAALHPNNVLNEHSWHSHVDHAGGEEHLHPVSLLALGAGPSGSLVGKVSWMQEASADFGKTELWWQARRAIRRHQIAMGFGLGALTGGSAYLLNQPHASAQKAAEAAFLERRCSAQQWNKQQCEQQKREQKREQERRQGKWEQQLHRPQHSSEEPLIWMEDISESSDTPK